MIAAIVDTHAIIWYLAADPHLSAAAKRFMDLAVEANNELAVSAITLVEMIYLIEKGRIPAQRFTELARILDDPASLFVEIPVDLKIARALSRVDVHQVPDMPDRIIAATALHLNVPVISRDGKITLSNVSTIW